MSGEGGSGGVIYPTPPGTCEGCGEEHGGETVTDGFARRESVTELFAKTEDPDLAVLLASGRCFIRCACTFLVVSDDMTECRLAMDDHECPLLPDPPDEPEPADEAFWRRDALLGRIATLLVGMALGLLLGFVLLR